MKILIDECLPAELADNYIVLGHQCQTVRQAGFGSKRNGELVTLAEGRWHVLPTSDRNINYQQNIAGRKISILVLCAKSNRMKDLAPLVRASAQALLSIQPGTLVEIGPLLADR
jgi:predicted nuclease of predicted toxin-antitoxin system